MDVSKDSLHGGLQLEWAIGLNRTALNILGVWPKENERKSWKSSENCRVYIGLTVMVNFLLIPQLCSLLAVRHNLMLVIDNLQISFPILAAVLKCTILWWKKETISPVVSAIENDWLKEKTTEEKSTMIKCARLTRNIALTGYVLVIIAWCIIVVLPCFGFTMRYVSNITDPGKRPLPLHSHFYFDVTKKSFFVLTFAFQAVGLIFTGIYFTGVDCFFAYLILHVCGQMENLSQHLTRLCNLTNFRAGMSFCVNEHVRLIRFVHIVDNAVNIMLLGQLFILTVLFCFQGFLFIEVIKKGDNLPVLRFIWLVGAIVIVLLHMFVYCFVGEILVACCEKMHGAAYNNEWYILQPNEARMLLLILIRGRPPLYVTAGKMFPMTMALFCNMIKTSVSYVSVLLAYS